LRKKGPLHTETEFLLLIAHNFKAVIATDSKLGIAILQSLQILCLDIGHFMLHVGAPPFQVKGSYTF